MNVYLSADDAVTQAKRTIARYLRVIQVQNVSIQVLNKQTPNEAYWRHDHHVNAAHKKTPSRS